MKAIINSGTYDEIIDQLRALDSNTDSLDMGRLKLHEFNIPQIINMINAIPEQVRILDLGSYGSNQLYKKSNSELDQIFSALSHKNLDNLIMQHTGFICGKGRPDSMEEKASLIALWPKTLKIYDLSYQDLHRQTPQEFGLLFAVKPPQATTLNLGSNGFHLVPAKKTKEIMELIPPNFNALTFNLETSTDQFRQNYPALEFKQVLMSIPSGITTLDLDFTQIHRLSTDYLNQLEGALPAITTLCLCGPEIVQMSTAQLDALTKMVPNAQEIIVKDYSGNMVTSEKIQYLQSNVEEKARQVVVKTSFALSQLEKGVPNESGKQTRRHLPEGVLQHTSEFFHRGDAISKGIKALRGHDNDVKKSDTDSPEMK